MVQTNLYDNQIYFAIIFDHQPRYIIEPDGWNKIQNRIPRDKKWYGFWSDFLEDKYGMRFSFLENGGGDLLKQLHDTNPDYDVFFEVGYKQNKTYQAINQWRINLNEYDCEIPGGVLTSIEKMPFQAKLRARMSSPCTVNQYNTVDGGILTPISTSTLRLHSKTLLLKSQAVSFSPQTTNDYHSTNGESNPLILQPDQTNLVINQLPQVFSQPPGLINFGSNTPAVPSQVNIYNDFLNQYTVQYAGLLDISVSYNFNFWFWHNNRQFAPAGIEPGWSSTSQLVIQRVIAGTPTNITVSGTPFLINSSSAGYSFGVAPSGLLVDVTGADRNNCNKVPVIWNEVYPNVAVEVGDNIYIHTVINSVGTFVDAVLLECQVDSMLGNVLYSQLTTTPGSTAPSYRVFDILTQQVENLTGQKNAVISSFFSPGGYGYKYLLANGYGIRNYTAPSYAFKSDLDSLLSSLQAIFCIGVGIRKIGNIEYLVIEGVNFFFNNNVIGVYTQTFKWKDKDSSSLRYNKAVLGYNKYEGLNILQQDEYCTQGTYLIQSIKTNDNTLDKRSSLVAAGYPLETQRRNQFIANPQQSLTFDEDIFIVATNEPCEFPSGVKDPISGLPWACFFTNSNSTIGFGMNSMALQKGDFIISSSGVNAGTIFTVIKEVEGYPIIGLDLYQVTPAPASEIINTTITILPSSPDQVFAERNQPFNVCSNVQDPSTIYNGRLALKNILFNWMPILGVGLFFVDINSQDKVKTRLVKMNSLFTHQFLSSETNKGVIGDTLTSEIIDEDIKTVLRNASLIYTPLAAECYIKIGWNEMNTIRLALCGELGDVTKDHGGLILQDSNGVNWFCQVQDVSYDFVKQMCKLDVQKVKQVWL